MNMSNLPSILQQLATQPPSWLLPVAAAGVLTLIVWNIVLSVLLIRVLLWTKRLFGNTKKDELKTILQEHIERVGVVQIKLNDLEKMLSHMQQEGLRHIQKTGIVRFNPFQDTGGDQSFVLALLDAENNGLVISSLHSRERTRIYAKPVRDGQAGEYPFSDEEKEAIRRAQNG